MSLPTSSFLWCSQVQASCEQAMRLWWEDYHPGWMIFTLGNQHFETLHQIIQYSQSSIIKGALQVCNPPKPPPPPNHTLPT